MLVPIHQYQLSTFFPAISHIPVNAVAEANASSAGTVLAENADRNQLRAEKMAT